MPTTVIVGKRTERRKPTASLSQAFVKPSASLYKQRVRYNGWMHTTATPPGPPEGYDLGGSDETLSKLREYFARFGDVYRVFAPSRGVYNYVINHPDDIKHVLLSNHRNYTKGEGMDRVKILLGNGIMTSEGDFWRRQRRMMQPAFHRRVLDRFAGLIHEVNEKYADRWAAKAARGGADQPHRRNQRAHPRDRAAVRFSAPISSAWSADSAPIRSRSSPRNRTATLKFAFRFRSLSKLVAEVIEHRRCRAGGALRLSRAC